MNLPIIQSILHGALRPNLDIQIDYSTLAHQFEKLPNELPQIEKLLTHYLSNYADFDFEKPISIGDIAPDTYTRLSRSKLSKSFALQISKPTNPKEKFYQTIVEAEIQRIKLTILDYSEIRKSDTDNRQMIIDLLRQILQYSQYKDDNNNSILNNCKIQLISLYIEVSDLSDNILTEVEDYLPFEDLIFNVFGRYPTDEENELYRTFKEGEKELKSDENTLPSNEEYEEDKIQTNYETFVQEVEKYRFIELPMVAKLSKAQRIKLIRLIVEHDTNYSVPMLKYIGYYDKLKKEYNMSNDNVFKHWAVALGKSKRAIKGNFNVLNPKSKEDPYRYNSADFVQKVEEDYQML